MILIIGNGYIGGAFARELDRTGWPFLVVTRSTLDYTRFQVLVEFLREYRPELAINAAAYIPKPSVLACDQHRGETILGNSIFPVTVACACDACDIPLAHISTGCLYRGGPHKEEDEPDLSFKTRCSFYTGSKEVAEQGIARITDRAYIWRIRLPFDRFNDDRNYLAKLLRFEKIHRGVNSLTHRGDFVRNGMKMWHMRAPWGTYHMTNRGSISSEMLLAEIDRYLKPNRAWRWFEDGELERIAGVPVSDCILDTSKLESLGIPVRGVEEAVAESLACWETSV